MKKFKARKEREQQEAIVRPRVEIEDPSAELFSQTRSWKHEDPLQESFIDQSLEQSPTRDIHRIPRLKVRNTTDSCSSPFSQTTPPFDLSSLSYDADPEAVVGSCPTASYMQNAPVLPLRHPDHTHHIPVPKRSHSLPPSRELEPLSTSPSKANFQLFSLRCAPSPTSTSPRATTPLFELSAEEAIYSIANRSSSESPIELDGSPIDFHAMQPAPLHFNKHPPELEPEASPYSRFTTFTKSIHALNANLSPIEETEEEAASRRSSLVQSHELPAMAYLDRTSLSAYSGGTSIIPRNYRHMIATTSELVTTPARNVSTRSSDSTDSTNSMHSMFSFEFSNSDTEKILASWPADRRKSSAPSLTDVSSVDDFDLELELDIEKRQSRSHSKRDTKLERFFGIRQYSVTSDSDSNLPFDPLESPTSHTDAIYSAVNDSSQSHKHSRSSISINDLDLSLSLENDPYKREIISMHKSLLSKSQSKQDAKLEKFFGCDKDQIQVARNSSTGSRLAGCTDDLNNRSIGW